VAGGLKTVSDSIIFSYIMKKAILLILLLWGGTRLFAATEAELQAQAERHYRTGNYPLALEDYDELVARFPLSDSAADARYFRAVSLLRLGRDKEALAAFQDIETRYRGTRYFQYVPFWLGTARQRLQDPQGAVKAFEAFLVGSRDPELVPQALLQKAQAELALGNPAAAARDLETLAGEHAGSAAAPRGVAILAFAYLSQGRATEVLTLSERTPPETLPEASRGFYRLYIAEALWALGRREEAVARYTELTSAEEAVAAAAYRRLFMGVQPEGDLKQLQDLMQKAESRFAGKASVLSDLWVQIGIESVRQGLLQLGEYFLGRAWAQPDRRSVPDTVPLYLAEIRLRRGEPAAAAALLEEYLALDPPRADRALLRLGEVRLRQESFAAAAALFERYLSSYPEGEDAPEATYRLAYARFRLGELDAASQLASRLLASQPPEPLTADLYRLQVAVHRKRGQSREAASLLAQYLEKHPQDVKARLDLLRLYFTLREYPALVAEAGRLVQQSPGLKDSDPYAYLLAGYLRGLAEIGRKQYGPALTALSGISREGTQKAGLEAIWPYNLYYQAWAQYRLNQLQPARDKAASLAEGFPGHPLFPEALYLAGWCAFTQGDYRAAAGYFGRLAKVEGETGSRALFLQAKSLANQGDKPGAAAAYRTLYTARPQSDFADDAMFEFAGLAAEQGQTSEATAAYSFLARRFPDSPLSEEALYKRAELLGAARSWQQARDAYYEYRTRYPRGRLVDASLYWGGVASAELGESFGAVLQWERLAQDFKGSPFRADALRRTAEAYAQRGDYAKAIALLSAHYQEYPEEAKAYGTADRLEELRYRQRGAGEREATLSSVIGREGGARTAKGREAMLELAQLYIYEGSARLELAPPMLQAVADKQEPASAASAQYLLGEYHFRKRELVTAANAFLKAAALNTADADRTAASLFRAAEMMSLAGRGADVRELSARLEKFFPGSQWTIEARKLPQGGTQ
jgi:TolA-binding protein